MQEHTRLGKEAALTTQLEYIECMSLGFDTDCNKNKIVKPDMQSVYDSILYAFGILMVMFIPISLFLSLFSIRPVRQASTMIDNFIANIVHDINTPVSTILLNTKSLIKNPKNPDKKLTRILASSKQLGDMQHDLLALADEKSEIEIDEVDLAEITEEIIEDFRLKHSSQPFVYELQEQMVYLNSIDLSRIIQNLISNAIKYNQNSNPIKLYIKDALLVIEDNGKGMNHPEKVFEKNYREDYSIQGNGLGLASVLAMLDRNHIGIEVSSVLGKGTIISLNFKECIKDMKRKEGH